MKNRNNGNRLAIIAVACLASAAMVLPASAAKVATIKGGQQVIHPGEAAQFDIQSFTDVSSELHVHCEVSSGGRATVMFDGEHYVPLSEPAVGDITTLSSGETRKYDLSGTVEANRGDAYVAFVFTGVPAAMCFPGMKCEGATGGAKDVEVTCNNE